MKMTRRCTFRSMLVRLSLYTVAAAVILAPVWGLADDEKDDKKADKKKPPASSESPTKVRWGKKRNETDEKYDKRYKILLKKIKQDTLNSAEAADVKTWTIEKYPFIVRSDISAEFTADTAMYMEMLHREYSEAFGKLLGKASDIKEPIEVVVFASPQTYMEKGGGIPGSGGFFRHSTFPSPDRDPTWKARRARLVQFTAGVTDFAKWHKGTLKHEAAHMEMQMRLGLGIETPRWWNEGQASVFEFWDFDRTVDENFALIPTRGRYAPAIRRLYGTPGWKDFGYVWNVDGAKWQADMTTAQGFLNYAQSWSLAAYMMNEGKKGRIDFRRIFDLSARVGSNAPPPRNPRAKGPAPQGPRAWDEAFAQSDRDKLDKNWNEWVKAKLPKDKENTDEFYCLARQGYNPDVKETLEHLTEESVAKLRARLEEMDKEENDKVQK